MMIKIPKNYKSKLGYRETEAAIKLIHESFEKNLAQNLNLERASAPLFVAAGTGINDDLNGYERAVSFDMSDFSDVEAQIVHSLAKWKRISLAKYGYKAGEGIYTNMNAIRRDEIIDNTHSVYVDQWDWEKVILKEDRNVAYLKKTVRQIVFAIIKTSKLVQKNYPKLNLNFEKKVHFITTQQLENKYPNLSSKQREDAICKEYRTVFLMQIGGKLASGKPHDGRAPDYDDWKLNGDLLFWDDALDASVEISSMGIRVDETALCEQLEASNNNHRKELLYHKMLLNGELPLSIGGGIGQSRLCMLLLQKAHIGEVHSSIWSKEMNELCEKNNILLL